MLHEDHYPTLPDPDTVPLQIGGSTKKGTIFNETKLFLDLEIASGSSKWIQQ
jgi:hypothetical protein